MLKVLLALLPTNGFWCALSLLSYWQTLPECSLLPPHISYLHGKVADWLQTGWEIWPLRLWRPSFREATLLLSGYSWGMYWQKGQLKICVAQIESQTYPCRNDYYGPKWLPFFFKRLSFLESVPTFLRSKPLTEMRCPSFLRPNSLWFLKSKWKS